MKVKIKGKGMVLYSAVSSPLDCSKRFTLSSPGRPVHSDTVLGFSWKHSSHAAIAQRLFTHISTTVYSQVLIYTAESTEASWSERKCPNFETVTTGIRTRALSIASPAFYQLSYRAPHERQSRGTNISSKHDWCLSPFAICRIQLSMNVDLEDVQEVVCPCTSGIWHSPSCPMVRKGHTFRGSPASHCPTQSLPPRC